jgi:hypothetical protein
MQYDAILHWATPSLKSTKSSLTQQSEAAPDIPAVQQYINYQHQVSTPNAWLTALKEFFQTRQTKTKATKQALQE